MKSDKCFGMEECAADPQNQWDLRRVLMNESERLIAKAAFNALTLT
jgi:hypothetical protein